MGILKMQSHGIQSVYELQFLINQSLRSLSVDGVTVKTVPRNEMSNDKAATAAMTSSRKLERKPQRSILMRNATLKQPATGCQRAC